MTVKEYLEIHNGKDISSVGIYDSKIDPTQSSDVIDVETNAIDIIPHLDREIDHVHLGIFDETAEDIYIW